MCVVMMSNIFLIVKNDLISSLNICFFIEILQVEYSCSTLDSSIPCVNFILTLLEMYHYISQQIQSQYFDFYSTCVLLIPSRL